MRKLWAGVVIVLVASSLSAGGSTRSDVTRKAADVWNGITDHAFGD